MLLQMISLSLLLVSLHTHTPKRSRFLPLSPPLPPSLSLSLPSVLAPFLPLFLTHLHWAAWIQREYCPPDEEAGADASTSSTAIPGSPEAAQALLEKKDALLRHIESLKVKRRMQVNYCVGGRKGLLIVVTVHMSRHRCTRKIVLVSVVLCC